MQPQRRLEGKVILITGASRNIGGTAAAGFAAHGAIVVCNDVDPTVAQQTADEIIAAGDVAIAAPGDVTDRAAIDAIVAMACERYGRIDVLMNNATIFRNGSILDFDPEQFQRQLEVILFGSFSVTQAVARSMVATGTGGSIINVLSTAAWQGEAGNLGYCTAKSGMINFTRSAAMDLAPYRIRVNSFTPTATRPADPERAQALETHLEHLRATGGSDFDASLPWERLPGPADYIGALTLLASDEGALMTGTNITVDGGALAKYWPQPPVRTRPSLQA